MRRGDAEIGRLGRGGCERGGGCKHPWVPWHRGGPRRKETRSWSWDDPKRGPDAEAGGSAVPTREDTLGLGPFFPAVLGQIGAFGWPRVGAPPGASSLLGSTRRFGRCTRTPAPRWITPCWPSASSNASAPTGPAWSTATRPPKTPGVRHRRSTWGPAEHPKIYWRSLAASNHH